MQFSPFSVASLSFIFFFSISIILLSLSFSISMIILGVCSSPGYGRDLSHVLAEPHSGANCSHQGALHSQITFNLSCASLVILFQFSDSTRLSPPNSLPSLSRTALSASERTKTWWKKVPRPQLLQWLMCPWI